MSQRQVDSFKIVTDTEETNVGTYNSIFPLNSILYSMDSETRNKKTQYQVKREEDRKNLIQELNRRFNH